MQIVHSYKICLIRNRLYVKLGSTSLFAFQPFDYFNHKANVNVNENYLIL